MSAYKFDSNKTSERESTACSRPSLMLDAEAVKQLRDQWCDYIFSLPKTPFEVQLAKARADRALELVRSNQRASVKPKAQSTPPKSCRRPLTDLHNSPRTTSRMKQVIEARMQPSKVKEPKSQYNLCPRCGLVKDSIFNHENAEKRLKKLLQQHPSLIPKERYRKSPRYLRIL